MYKTLLQLMKQTTLLLINRYDSSKTFTENVELTNPITSRFDIPCVVKVRFINSKTVKKKIIIDK
jgi:MCM P-loop domain